MEIDSDKLLERSIRDGITDAVKSKLGGYGGPMEKLLSSAFEKHVPAMRTMLEEAIASCIGDAEFVETIRSAVRHKLANTLIQRFGGEMEKQVNVLKSDPTTRARITLAIEKIVKQKT